MALEHARWNITLGVPCEFTLLNCVSRGGGPSVEGVDYVCFDDSKTDVQTLERLLQQNPPRGVTPLADRLAEIHRRIAAQAQELALQGQMVFLTIVTDGLPTSVDSGTSTASDKDALIKQLRGIATKLPVQLVIRLCTNDDEVVRFYNEIDEEAEFPMDVLDDLNGEATEIAKAGNDWFVYTPLLHRIREAGTLCKLLDDIDERSFGKVEMQRFVQLMSPDQTSCQLSCVDPDNFLAQVSRIAANAPPVFDSLSGKAKPFVDTTKLRRRLRIGGGGFACFAWCF